MDIRGLKQDLMETLDGIDKDQMDLCGLKEYAEIVKVVSEIRDKDPIEVFSDIMATSREGGRAALGFGGTNPRTIRELKEARKFREEDDE